jgi:hypothetical protein
MNEIYPSSRRIFESHSNVFDFQYLDIVVPDSALAARIIPVKNDFADKFAKSAL